MDKYMTYEDILQMIARACNAAFYTGVKDIKASVVESAAQIYVAQMNTQTQKEG